jgi:hypothetical protein
MYDTRKPHQRLLPGLGASIFTVLLALLTVGCATLSPEEEASFELRDIDRYVRLVTIETGAGANDHPHSINAQQLQARLAALTATGNLIISDDETPLFTDDEVAEIATPIAAALSRARPDQDVIFQSAGARGLFRSYSEPSYTTGRLFVKDGKLNLIVGVAHERPDASVAETLRPKYPVGSRNAARQSGWQLAEEKGERVEGRQDWIALPLGSAPALATPVEAIETAPASEPSPPAQTVDERTREFENRLRVLDDLKARQLITDEEYRQRRQAILEGI